MTEEKHVESGLGGLSGKTVVFEELDGMFWLSGRDLELGQVVLGIRTEADRIGLEREFALSCVAMLQQRKLRVAIRRGSMLHYLVRQPDPIEKPKSRRLEVAPESLVGRQELERLDLKASRNGAFAALVEEAKAGAGDDTPIYIYAVNEGWFEVDWQLTCVSEAAVEARALAAHQRGSSLRCLLVQPKPKRARVCPLVEVKRLVEKRETFGQLRLPI